MRDDSRESICNNLFNVFFMERNYFVNMWLRYMLRLMKEREGMVIQSSKEGHISKNVFRQTPDDIAGNIHSAEHLVRMILLWARDSELTDNDLFDKGWAALGKYTMELMARHGDAFCRGYSKKS